MAFRQLFGLFAVALLAVPGSAAVPSLSTSVANVGQLDKPAIAVEMYSPAKTEAFPAGFVAGAVADEFLSIVAEVAVDRARRQGLGLVKRQIENGVCGLELNLDGWSKTHRLNATCTLVKTTDLQALVGQGRALRGALTDDAVVLVSDEVAANMSDVPPLAHSVHASLVLVRRIAADPKSQLTQNDVWLVADPIVNGDWTQVQSKVDIKQFNILKVSVASARVYLDQLNNGKKPEEIDLASIIRAVINTHCSSCDLLANPADYERLVDWSTLAVRAVSAIESGKADHRERLRASIQLAFDAYSKLKRGHKMAEWGKRLTLAAFDADAPRLISTVADAVKENLEEKCTGPCPKLRKITALLTGVSTYAITYQEGSLEQATAAEIAALQNEKRQARKEALESVIDAATVREGREGDYLIALGTGVGALLTGTQRISTTSFTNSTEDHVSGQLHIPVGVSFQRLPFRTTRWNDPRTYGLHGMVSLLDLGYYLAETPDGSNADWQSLFAPGVQIGVILGRNPNSFFVLGYDISKSPRFAADDRGNRRSATRHGVVLHYYFSLFDLN